MHRAVRFECVLLGWLACATGCSFLASHTLDKASSQTGQVEGGTSDAPSDEGAASSGSSSGASSGSSSGSLPEAAPADAGSLSCATALTLLGQCMAYADFIAKTGGNGYAASDIASAQTVSYGTCSACHSKGTGGFYADTDPMLTFTATTQVQYILPWITCTADAQGHFQGFVPSSAIVDVGAGCDSGMPCSHPPYQLPMGLASAIDTFETTSIARWNAGMCPAPPADGGAD
jgi:hypothetical protein